MKLLSTKKCLFCNKRFFKKKKEAPNRWKNRICCCKSHSLKYAWQNNPERKKEMSKRSKIIVKEQWSNSKHRKSISKQASAQLKREYENGTRDPYKITKQARKICFSKYGSGGYLKEGWKNDPDWRAKIDNGIIEKYGSILNMLKQGAFVGLSEAGCNGSKLEDVMAKFLDKKDREYIRQFQIGRRRIDFYLPEEDLFVEVDGYPFHQDKKKERERDYEILSSYPDHLIAHVTYKENPPKWEFFELN